MSDDQERATTGTEARQWRTYEQLTAAEKIAYMLGSIEVDFGQSGTAKIRLWLDGLGFDEGSAATESILRHTTDETSHADPPISSLDEGRRQQLLTIKFIGGYRGMLRERSRGVAEVTSPNHVTNQDNSVLSGAEPAGYMELRTGDWREGTMVHSFDRLWHQMPGEEEPRELFWGRTDQGALSPLGSQEVEALRNTGAIVWRELTSEGSH